MENAVQTLHACLAHAGYVAFSDYHYTDRNWALYDKWRSEVFDKLSKDEKKKLYEEERRSNISMAPAECLVDKVRKHTDYDMMVTAMFPQTWGSTALGFGGIGGQAITTAYVCAIESKLTGEYAVYFGGQLAYVISRPNEKFFKDIANHSMVDSKLGKRDYERST